MLNGLPIGPYEQITDACGEIISSPLNKLIVFKESVILEKMPRKEPCSDEWKIGTVISLSERGHSFIGMFIVNAEYTERSAKVLSEDGEVIHVVIKNNGLLRHPGSTSFVVKD